MLDSKHKQLSLHSILYNKIPENHLLRLINSAVDFSFINLLLEGSYCKYYGRPAKEPEMMAKLLIIQYLYNLSDVQVIRDTAVNLAYMWFIGINPEDDLPNPSLLAKFRTQRLKDTSLDDIIKEVVKQCVDKGIIKGTGLSIDCTHVAANTTKKVPERIIKHLAKKILKNLEQENKSIPTAIDTNIPDYKLIEDHKVAKATMKSYLEQLIESVENIVDITVMPQTEQSIKKAKAILSDPKFILQKSIRSLVDEDARVGYKSKTDSFFGYKVEYAMIPEERIITAVGVQNGAYVDGTEFEKLYQQTKDSGARITEAYGDKAYFRKPILDILKEDEIQTYIPVSETVYRLDESRFKYNKDSGQWFCEYGNHTVYQKKTSRKDGRHYIIFKFEKETCQSCLNREACINGSSKTKILILGLNTPEFYEYSQRAKTPEFLEKYKKRASQEWKNGEMKRFHGLRRARGYGLRSMATQAKLTAIAVNLKRIASLVSSVSKAVYNFLINTFKTNVKYTVYHSIAA